MPAFRTVVSVLVSYVWEKFLYELKAGPAGGRLRRPSSRRQRHDGHRRTGLTAVAELPQPNHCRFIPEVHSQ
jgi:hypothetical protein